MTGFTVRMPIEYREPNIIVSISFAEYLPSRGVRSCRRRTGVKERITTFGAEEMQFMVVSLSAQSGIIERNKTFVHDRRLAVEAARSEPIVIVQMTICLALVLVRRDMLKQGPTVITPKHLRQPSVLNDRQRLLT